MDHFIHEFQIDSAEKVEFMDVTDKVREAVQKSKIKNGVVTVFTQHTTTAIRINENEEGLMRDIKCFLEKQAPIDCHYEHDELDKRDVPEDEQINAHSHLKSLLMATSENIPLANSEMLLGKWQSVFFVELDGPRKRKLIVQVIGE
jgi:secondary thiamine-phosphate synthase enzyme|tara:strand:+ start:285 stop:722 length:438 start_codon:yes stop_codon:yes gene_type:complete